MTDVEQALLTALLDFEEMVRLMKTSQPKPNLMPQFERIDALTQQLPSDADPTLIHYLRKKSYEKARLWLQGRENENQRGNCGHVA